MSMDDKELERLFGKTEEEDKVTDEKDLPKEESSVSVAKNDKEKKKERTKERSEEKGKEKLSFDLNASLEKISSALRLKIERLKGAIRESKQRKAERVPSVPLRERVYLPNFPLSFKQLLLVLLGCSILTLILSVLLMPAFRVRRVIVKGNIVLSKDRIMEEAGIEYDSHIWSGISGNLLDIIKLDYGKVEDRILEEEPHLKDIRITASFPSTVRIEVTERNKIAYIKMPDGYAAIDDEGTVIELETLENDGLSHAVISGLEVSGAVISDKIDIKDKNDYKKALIVLGAIITADANGEKSDYDMFGNVKEIRIIPGGNIFLTINLPTGSEFQVKLKDIDMINEDMLWLRYAISKDSFEGLPNGNFDMTGDEYIYREYR